MGAKRSRAATATAITTIKAGQTRHLLVMRQSANSASCEMSKGGRSCSCDKIRSLLKERGRKEDLLDIACFLEGAKCGDGRRALASKLL